MRIRDRYWYLIHTKYRYRMRKIIVSKKFSIALYHVSFEIYIDGTSEADSAIFNKVRSLG